MMIYPGVSVAPSPPGPGGSRRFRRGKLLAAEALAIATTFDHPHGIVFASIGAGRVDLGRGEIEDALAILERAHAVCARRRSDRGAHRARGAARLGVRGDRSGREAIALLEEAVAQAIALRHGFGHVLRTGGLAEAYLAGGRVEDAPPWPSFTWRSRERCTCAAPRRGPCACSPTWRSTAKSRMRGRDAGARRRARHRGELGMARWPRAVG